MTPNRIKQAVELADGFEWIDDDDDDLPGIQFGGIVYSAEFYHQFANDALAAQLTRQAPVHVIACFTYLATWVAFHWFPRT